MKEESQDKVVRTAARLQVRRSAVRIPAVEEIFSSPKSPDRLWGPPSLLLSGYRGFSGGEAAGAWMLTADLHLVSGLRMSGVVHSLPLYLSSPVDIGSIFLPCVAIMVSR